MSLEHDYVWWAISKSIYVISKCTTAWLAFVQTLRNYLGSARCYWRISSMKRKFVYHLLKLFVDRPSPLGVPYSYQTSTWPGVPQPLYTVPQTLPFWKGSSCQGIVRKLHEVCSRWKLQTLPTVSIFYLTIISFSAKNSPDNPLNFISRS